ncbi:MAG: FkbM family methyltransferase [Myxococcales bacterium]|nr:FkbM family methyltransferase [Myxococcales bacterium]
MAALSSVRNFELPPDEVLPFFKLSMLFGTYEADSARVFRRVLGPGMCAIDCGAHAGYFTLLFSRLVGPSGKVVALEPFPCTFDVLSRNLTRRGAGNVLALRKAVSNKNGLSTFYVTSSSVSHTLLPIKEWQKEVAVETVRIDELVSQLNLQDVRLVKLDVEGAEGEALEGMRGLISRKEPLNVVLEYKPHLFRRRNLDPREFLHSLMALGFELFVIRHGGEPTRIFHRDSGAISGQEKCNLLATRG